MKRNIIPIVGKIIYGIFILYTLILGIIVFNDMNPPYAYRIGQGYVITLLVTILYSVLAVVINLRKLKLNSIKRILTNFIIGFFIICLINVIYHYISKGQINFSENIGSSLIISLSCSLGEVIFIKRNNE